MVSTHETYLLVQKGSSNALQLKSSVLVYI